MRLTEWANMSLKMANGVSGSRGLGIGVEGVGIDETFAATG